MTHQELRAIYDLYEHYIENHPPLLKEELQAIEQVTFEEALAQIHRIHILPERAQLKAREDMGMTGRPPDYGAAPEPPTTKEKE